MKQSCRLIMLIISIIGFSCQSMVKETSWDFFSPDNNIKLRIELKQGQLQYAVESNGVPVLNTSTLGIVRTDADLSRELSFIEKSQSISLDERIKFITGKQLDVEVTGNYHWLDFENPKGNTLRLEIKIFNDGLAMRYVFPEQSGQMVTVVEDLMTFSVPEGSRCWLQPYDRVSQWTPAYEWYYVNGQAAGQVGEFGHGWCFPALFDTGNQWLLLSEAGIDGNYSGSHLDNQDGSSIYTLRWPEESEANALGSARPGGNLPWQTSWKTIAIGDLNTIINSQLVKILCPANRIEDTSWIKPGRVSWSWLSDHPSPKDFNKLISFIDLAAEMNWEYSLVDANWNEMEGGTIEQLVEFAAQNNVGILMWYNSGGPHNKVTEAPRDIMNDRQARRKEFEKLQKLGVKGVKIDFFQSDKAIIMELYKEILEDAAEFKIMVNFHGCTIPRGWSRTYPHLITMESVRGGECYSFDESYAARAPELNTILPFTRNVIGSMDYTPVIFSDLVTPHLTSYAHEIALSIVFESGWLHFGDGVAGYQSLGAIEKGYLGEVPVTWDQTRLISGIPGKDLVLARRKGEDWYIAGINGEDLPKSWSLDLSTFQGEYLVTRITDGEKPDQLVASSQEESGVIDVEALPYGGFAIKLTPVSNLASLK